VPENNFRQQHRASEGRWEGGIACRTGMAFQGRMENISSRGTDQQQAQKARRPISRMLENGVPRGAGTRTRGFELQTHTFPSTGLSTVVRQSGGGAASIATENRVDREEASRLYTMGSSWFSTEVLEKKKKKRDPRPRPKG